MMMASHHQEAIWDIAIRASLADLGIADRGGPKGTSLEPRGTGVDL